MTELGPIKIRLTAEGIQEAIKKFEDLSKKVVDLDKDVNRKKVAEAKKAQALIDRDQKNANMAMSRADAQRLKDEKKAGEEGVRDSKKNWNQKQKDAEKAVNEQKKLFSSSAKEREKLAGQTAKAEQRFARETATEERKQLAAVWRERQQQSKQNVSLIIREAHEEMAAMASVRRQRSSMQAEMIASRRAQIGGHVQTGLSAVGRTLNRVGALGGAALALGGGVGIMSAFQREMAISKAAVRASRVSDVPGHPEENVSAAELTGLARQVGKEYNIYEPDLLTGTEHLISRSSRGKTILPVVSELAKISKAEGVDLNEMFTTAGIMLKQDPNLTNKQIIQAQRVLIGQGRSLQGSAEYNVLAEKVPLIMSTSNMYTGEQARNMDMAGSLFQVAFKQLGDVSMAANAVRVLPHYLTEKKFKKITKLDVSDPANGLLRNPEVMLAETLRATAGPHQMEKISQIFGAGRGGAGALATGLLSTYQAGEAEKKGGGYDAVLKYFSSLNTVALKPGDVDRHLGDVRSSSGEQVDQAFQNLERELDTHVVPELIKLVPVLAKLTPMLGSMAEMIAAHPWASVFALLGANVTSAIVGKIAKDMIADKITSAIVAKIAGKTIPGAGVPGIGGGILPLIVQAGAVASAGALIYGASAASRNSAAQSEALTDSDKIQEDLKKRKQHVALLSRPSPGADRATRATTAMAIDAENTGISIDEEKLKKMGVLMADGFIKKVKDSPVHVLVDNSGERLAGPRSHAGNGMNK